MVDPNRRINHLTDDDVEFLNECEEEFRDRFTEADPNFKSLCDKEARKPPIIENWMNRQYDGYSNNRGGYNRGHRYNNYNNSHRYNRGDRGGDNYRDRGYQRHRENYNTGNR